MENKTNEMESKTALLKESRLRLLRLHKLLVDIEREQFEKENGEITSGQFLNLLLNEQNFQWLRKFSILIVDIDEMMDLNDGFSEETVEKHLSQMREIIELKTPDEEFNGKYLNYLQTNSEIADKNNELKTLLADE